MCEASVRLDLKGLQGPDKQVQQFRNIALSFHILRSM